MSPTPPSQCGRLEWIGLSPGPRGAIESVQQVTVAEGKGLLGDHHAKGKWSRRQVTIIQAEHLLEIARDHGVGDIPPEKLRRNLVVSGIDLLTLIRQRFRIGEVVLQGTGPCDPCGRMDENLGPGGKKAMKDKGGITARVLKGGSIRIGDMVSSLPNEEANLLFPQ